MTLTTCWRCGQNYTTKAHVKEADCIRSLQRRNARDRERYNGVASELGDVKHEVSRLAQRVEMLAVKLEVA